MTPAEKELNRIIGRHKLIHKRLRRKLIEVAAHYAPYEEFAHELDMQSNQDRLLLWSLLDEDGVYSPKHVQAIGELGRLFYSLMPQPRTSPEDLNRKFQKAVNATMNAPLFVNGRILACQALREAANYSFIQGSQDRIRALGYERACTMVDTLIAQGQEGPISARIMNLHVLAAQLRQLGRLPEIPNTEGLTLADVQMVLKDTDFAPTTGKGIEVAVPRIFRQQMQMRFYVFAHERTDPRLSISFRIEIFGHLHVAVALSRGTGELMPADLRLLPLTHIFHPTDAMPQYNVLKRMCTFAALKCTLDGTLSEREYARFTPPPTPAPVVEPVAPPSSQDPNANIPEHLRTWQPHQPMPEALPDLEEEPPQTSEVVRSLRRSGNLTWRKIMSTLRRLGVTVDFGGKHPKLRKNGHSTPFLNPHSEENVEHNRRVLRRALAELGISEADFERAR